MVTFTNSVVISKPLEQTYMVAEQYPKFVDFYKDREIINSDDYTSEVRVSSVFLGLKFIWKGMGIKERNKKLTWVQSEGLLSGMRAEWIFAAIPQGTNVTLQVTYDSKSPFWDKIASVIFIRKTVPKILQCLKVACE